MLDETSVDVARQQVNLTAELIEGQPLPQQPVVMARSRRRLFIAERSSFIFSRLGKSSAISLTP